MDAIRVKLTTAPKAVDHIPKNVDHNKIFLSNPSVSKKKLITFVV